MKSLCITAALAASGVAQASSIQATASLAGVTDLFGEVQLEQFDSNLGTLNSVDLSITADVDGSFFFQNTGGANKLFTLNYVDWSVDVTGFGGSEGNLLNVDWVTAPTPSNPFGGGPGHFNIGFTSIAGGESSFTEFGELYSANYSYTDLSTELSSFVGDGTVDFDVAVPVLFSFSVFGDGQYFAELSTTADITVSAVYNYTPIPTPGVASVALLGAVAGIRRRR